MMSDDTRPAPEDDERLARLYAEYADRLNAGESLDYQAILDAHPDVGKQLVDDLRMLQGVDFPSARRSTLGSIGDYTLLAEIGRGGMGVVYDAWQGSLERRVALKVLPAGLAADNRAFMRFMREAKAAAQDFSMEHPLIGSLPGRLPGVRDVTRGPAPPPHGSREPRSAALSIPCGRNARVSASRNPRSGFALNAPSPARLRRHTRTA